MCKNFPYWINNRNASNLNISSKNIIQNLAAPNTQSFNPELAYYSRISDTYCTSIDDLERLSTPEKLSMIKRFSPEQNLLPEVCDFLRRTAQQLNSANYYTTLEAIQDMNEPSSDYPDTEVNNVFIRTATLPKELRRIVCEKTFDVNLTDKLIDDSRNRLERSIAKARR